MIGQYRDGNGIVKTGWYQADGNWYYIRGGRALTSERTVINNVWYEFDENGAAPSRYSGYRLPGRRQNDLKMSS